MNRRKTTMILGLILAMALWCAPGVAQADTTQVDLELYLMLDVSASVNSTEFNLQRQGYVDAFRNTSIINLITDKSDGHLGQIAVSLGYFSDGAVTGVDWFLIDSETAAYAFADAVAAAARPNNVGMSTDVAGAIEFSSSMVLSNDYLASRMVIDISGDGVQNVGGGNQAYRNDLTADARDDALAAGITTINGITIGTGDAQANVTELKNFYANYVIGGTDAFAMHTNSFEDFGDAIYDKLYREIGGEDPSGTPEPGTMMLMGSALGLGAWFRRRRRQA